LPKIPVLKPEEVLRALKNLGFKEVRQKGSHKGRDVSPVLLKKILKDINVSVEDFLEALKK